MKKMVIGALLFAGVSSALIGAFLLLGDSVAQAAKNHRNFVVALRGTVQGEERLVNGVMQICWEVDLVDVATERVIGVATECFDPASITPIGDDGGFAGTATTFFPLPGGTLVALSRANVQPVEDTASGIFITGEVSDEDNILGEMSTGRYADATGNTRLSGIVDMSEFDSLIVTFDCIFVIDLN